VVAPVFSRYRPKRCRVAASLHPAWQNEQLQQPEQRDGGGPGEVGATEAFAGRASEVLEEAMAADQRPGILAQPIRQD
jgi:hypothetical protein